MKKILGICGSPRVGGNSEATFRKIIKGCSEFAEVEQLLLSQEHFQLCDGCLTCETTYQCHFADIHHVHKTISEADAVIITTPVYFDSIPAVLKNLLDRMNPLCEQLKGKQAYIITVGQADETSWMWATNYLENYFSILEIEVIGKLSFLARDIGDIERNESFPSKIEEAIKTIQYHITESIS
jgi:multimeric flavodoxin WrbA